MRDDIVHLLVGYDPTHGKVAYREKIPRLHMREVLNRVKPDADDPDALYAYPVVFMDANDIMGLGNLPRGSQDFEYFVQSAKSS